MSILRLAFSLLVIFVLWSLFVKARWTQHVLAYLWHNYTISGALAGLIDQTEKLEFSVEKRVQTRSNWAYPLPEDLQQRSAKLPELLRSCIVSLKDVQSSQQYEGFAEARRMLGEVVNEIYAVKDAAAQFLAPGGDVPGHPTLNVSNDA